MLEHARTRFNDYGPLLRLQRYDAADQLLHHCREIFEQANAVAELGAVFSALADLQGELGQYGAAKRFEEIAFRYRYAVQTPEGAAISHFNLAIHLRGLGSDPRDVLGHRLAATLTRFATGSGNLAANVSAVADDLGRAGDQAGPSLPTDFASLCATVQQVPGVRFQELMERLLPSEDLDQALQAIIAKATEINKAV